MHTALTIWARICPATSPEVRQHYPWKPPRRSSAVAAVEGSKPAFSGWCIAVSRGRYVAFQMAEVAIPLQMFREILRLIAELQPQQPPVPA